MIPEQATPTTEGEVISEPKGILDDMEKMLIKEREVLLNNYEVMKYTDGKSTVLILEYSPIKKIDEKKLFRIF